MVRTKMASKRSESLMRDVAVAEATEVEVVIVAAEVATRTMVMG